MDTQARNVVHHGPIDPSILYLQSEHCSTSIWDRKVCYLQSYCTYNKNTWTILTALCTVGPSSIVVSTEQGHSSLLTCVHIGSFTPCLLTLEFYGVHWIEFVQLNWHLIPALIKRCRIETDTFHLPIGQCTITLQDVALLLCLLIDEEPVTRNNQQQNVTEWRDMCLD